MNLAEQLKEAQGKVEACEGQVKGLTAERDTLAEQVKDLTGKQEAATGQITDLTAERDALTEQVKAAEAERETAASQLKAAEAERDALKARLELSPGHKDLSAGTDLGSSGTTGAESGKDDDSFLKAYNAASPAEKTKMWRERQKGGFMKMGAMLAVAALLAVGLVGGVMASPRNYGQVILETTNASTGTVANTVSDTLVGAIENITITVPSGVTVDVAVASSDITILTVTDATGTATYLPRFPTHGATGVETNTLDKIVVVDTVTASYDEASTTNATVRTVINYSR